MTDAIRSHGTMLQMGDGGAAGSPVTITSTAAGTVYTLVTAEDHGLAAGAPVTIADVAGTGATAVNGSWNALPIDTDVFAVKVATTGAGTGGTATPSAESFTTVAKVGDIKGPELTRETIDMTTHDSLLDYEELVAGIKRSGEVSAPIHWIPTDPTHDDATGLYAAYEDGDTRNWRLVVPDFDTDPSYLAFRGFVTSLSPAMPVNGALTAEFKIKVVGAPTLHLHA